MDDDRGCEREAQPFVDGDAGRAGIHCKEKRNKNCDVNQEVDFGRIEALGFCFHTGWLSEKRGWGGRLFSGAWPEPLRCLGVLIIRAHFISVGSFPKKGGAGLLQLI